MPDARLQRTRNRYRQLNAGDNPAGQALANIADANEAYDRAWTGIDYVPLGEDRTVVFHKGPPPTVEFLPK